MTVLTDLRLHQSWAKHLTPYLTDSNAKALESFLQQRLAVGAEILPAKHQWFHALNSTPLDTVKVVVLGQDPYPTPGHAHGLCFSVLPDVQPLAKSLINVFKELESDLGQGRRVNGCLQGWADQGVLLLNTVLTVEVGMAGAHKNQGWENITDAIIAAVSREQSNTVFVLWGKDAHKKSGLIDSNKHLVLQSPHPSPLAAYRGFWGSQPFSKTNSYLLKYGKSAINWA